MEKNCLTKKTITQLFFSQNWFVNLSEYIWIFSDFFLTFEFFFFLVLKKLSKVAKFGYVFAQRLRTTLKKFLDNRSKFFANMTRTFVDKRGFPKLEKKLKQFMFSDKLTNQFWLKKSYITVFHSKTFFSLIFW